MNHETQNPQDHAPPTQLSPEQAKALVDAIADVERDEAGEDRTAAREGQPKAE